MVYQPQGPHLPLREETTDLAERRRAPDPRARPALGVSKLASFLTSNLLRPQLRGASLCLLCDTHPMPPHSCHEEGQPRALASPQDVSVCGVPHSAAGTRSVPQGLPHGWDPPPKGGSGLLGQAVGTRDGCPRGAGEQAGVHAARQHLAPKRVLNF